MERRQLESTTASNRCLRGLLAVPAGVVLLASGLGNMESGPFRAPWLVPACALAGAGAFALLMRYYNENYGRVSPKVGRRNVVGLIGAIAAMAGVPAVVQLLDLPVNGIAVSWAVVALAYYAMTIGLQRHHVAVWATVLVAGLLPLWGDARTTNAANVGLVMVGAAIILTGVLDHRLLVRTFGPSQEPRLESSDAGA